MYWNEEGRARTQDTVDLAVKAAKENNIKYIVVASNTGETAKKLEGLGVSIVCVTHASGFKGPGENEMDPETRKELEGKGVKVLTCVHALSGIERACSLKFGGIYPAEIMANALRMLGQGVKVCVEIATMAMDAGMLPYGQSIIAIGGTGRGADTAVIMKAAHAKDIFGTRIEEIICKPR